MKRLKLVPTEHQEQSALFEWSAIESVRRPELALLFAIPNGGKRSKLTAAKLKLEGVKAGVPDAMLPVARGSYHGLFLEMKRIGGRVSPSQVQWLTGLMVQGYCCRVAYGSGEAIELVTAYLEGKL